MPLQAPRSARAPALQVTAKVGQLTWFHGALPHGGMTCEAVVDDCEWKPATRCHLDSSHHQREQGCFHFERSEDICFPLSRSKFMTDLIPVLNLVGGDNICIALTEISNRSEDSCKLTKEQAVTRNKHLVGQRSDTLDLLTPDAPLGPVVLLEQMKETVERLEQLVGTRMDPKMKRQVAARGCGCKKAHEAKASLNELVARVRAGLAPEVSKRKTDDGPAAACVKKGKN